MKNIILKFLKNNKAFISIETLIIATLVIGVGIASIISFNNKLDGSTSTSKQIAYDDTNNNLNSSINKKNSNVSEQKYEPKKEAIPKPADNTHDFIYDVIINVIGSIIGTIVLGLIALCFRKNKTNKKQKID